MISIFELFSIGVGPSSSHTVGPMRAGYSFSHDLQEKKLLAQTAKITIELFGSLAHTGKGHATDKAVLMGAEGHLPENVNPDYILPRFEEIHQTKVLNLAGKHLIPFDINHDLLFNYEVLLPKHTNGMRYSAYDKNQALLLQQDYYSVGGGFIITDTEKTDAAANAVVNEPYPFDTADELLAHCQKNNKTIAEIMMLNEIALRDESSVRERILNVIRIMFECIDRGMQTEGILPGGLHVRRRAPILAKALRDQGKLPTSHEQTDSMAWLNVYAIAVNEENAMGNRVVTAPTNGAAGIIPAVLRYYHTFYSEANQEKLIEYLLTAAAITVLYKKGASLSAAEMGCQGEVGVAASMAAGAFAAVLGGTMTQVASAAEIAMEHNLGLTCDPIGGLVQIPCIERNAIGAATAINAARLALLETGEHKKVSLDKVIDTMRRTGHDMSDKYKETSKGGLAKIKVNVIEC